MRRMCIALAAAAMAVPAVHAADPAGTPRLRINDPFVAPVWRLGVDAHGSILAMGSPAKAVAVWSLDAPEHEPLINRVPIRESEEQQRAHAVAVDPTGNLIAYGVPPLSDDRGLPKPGTARIYVIEAVTGRMAGTIDEVSTRAQDLKFSPDGRYLAAGLSDGCGMRLWSTAEWQLVKSDDAGYGGEAPSTGSQGQCCSGPDAKACDHLPDTTSVTFAPDPSGKIRLFTSGDTGVRMYDLDAADAVPVRHWRPADLGLERPDGMATSPDGKLLAIGDRRRRDGASGRVRLRVAVVDLATLALSRHFEIGERELLHPGFLDLSQSPGANQMSLNRVAWLRSENNLELVAGGGTFCQIAKPQLVSGPSAHSQLDNCLVRWAFTPGEDAATAPPARFVRVGTDRVMDLHPIRDHAKLVFATQRRIAAISPDGELVPLDEAGGLFDRTATLFDFRDRAKINDPVSPVYLDFAVSADAHRVYFEAYNSTPDRPAQLSFDVRALQLQRYTAVPADAHAPLHDQLHVSPAREWKGQRSPPAIFGIESSLPRGTVDSYRAVATTSDGTAVVASSNFLRLLKADIGTMRLLCETRISSEAHRVNLSSDGRLIVVGHSDGTIRWYSVENGSGDNEPACRLLPRLSVSIRETSAGSGEWTWLAALPGSGYFAADAAARNLVEWQTTGPDGHVRRVDTRLVWQPLLKPEAIRTSLTTAPPPQSSLDRLREIIREKIDPTAIAVAEPRRGEALSEETFPLVVNISGEPSETSKPRKLLIRTGGGHPVSVAVNGRPLGPAEPVMVSAGGQLALQVTLPHAARRTNGQKQLCFILDAWEKGCHSIVWTGPLAPPRPRHLHAVLVGVSDYGSPKLNLIAPDNDAIDLASVFIDDYRTRVIDKTSDTAPDFFEADIRLLLSTSSAAKKTEAAELAKLPFVSVHDARRETLLKVLDELERTAARDDDVAHRYLFFFAGHGFVDLRNGANRSALLFPPTRTPGREPANLYDQSLHGIDIVERLEKLPGEKVVILDACRTPIEQEIEARFDPGRLEQELAERATSATLMFGSKAGQVAREQTRYVIKPRTAADTGNGVFTYSLVKALTSPEADFLPDPASRGRIELVEVEQFFRSFFNTLNPESPGAQLLRSTTAANAYLQEPTIVRPRRPEATIRVLRTLDEADRQATSQTKSMLCSWPFLSGWTSLCK